MPQILYIDMKRSSVIVKLAMHRLAKKVQVIIAIVVGFSTIVSLVSGIGVSIIAYSYAWGESSSSQKAEIIAIRREIEEIRGTENQIVEEHIGTLRDDIRQIKADASNTKEVVIGLSRDNEWIKESLSRIMNKIGH